MCMHGRCDAFRGMARAGLEPASLAAPAPKTGVYAVPPPGRKGERRAVYGPLRGPVKDGKNKRDRRISPAAAASRDSVCPAHAQRLRTFSDSSNTARLA